MVTTLFGVLKFHKLDKVEQAVKRTVSVDVETGSCPVSWGA
jgi:hypothetical protein